MDETKRFLVACNDAVNFQFCDMGGASLKLAAARCIDTDTDQRDYDDKGRHPAPETDALS